MNMSCVSFAPSAYGISATTPISYISKDSNTIPLALFLLSLRGIKCNLMGIIYLVQAQKPLI